MLLLRIIAIQSGILTALAALTHRDPSALELPSKNTTDLDFPGNNTNPYASPYIHWLRTVRLAERKALDMDKTSSFVSAHIWWESGSIYPTATMFFRNSTKTQRDIFGLQSHPESWGTIDDKPFYPLPQNLFEQTVVQSDIDLSRIYVDLDTAWYRLNRIGWGYPLSGIVFQKVQFSLAGGAVPIYYARIRKPDGRFRDDPKGFASAQLNEAWIARSQPGSTDDGVKMMVGWSKNGTEIS